MSQNVLNLEKFTFFIGWLIDLYFNIFSNATWLERFMGTKEYVSYSVTYRDSMKKVQIASYVV